MESMTEPDSYARISFPASENEIIGLLERLDISERGSGDIAYSIIPQLTGADASNCSINALDALAEQISGINARGELKKYKAILDYYGCRDINGAACCADFIESFELDASISSPEALGIQTFMKEYGIADIDAYTLKFISFHGYGKDTMRRNNIRITEYGLVRPNGDVPQQLSQSDDTEIDNEMDMDGCLQF